MRTAVTKLLKVERHVFGPRCYVVGRRLHECHAGVGLALGSTLTHVAAHVTNWLFAPSLGVAVWMIVKDWRDFFPSRRDTTVWSPGIHRRRAEECAPEQAS